MERIDHQATAGLLDESSRDLIDAEKSLHPDPMNMVLKGEERSAEEIFAERLAKIPPAQHAAFLAYVAQSFGNSVMQRTLKLVSSAQAQSGGMRLEPTRSEFKPERQPFYKPGSSLKDRD